MALSRSKIALIGGVLTLVVSTAGVMLMPVTHRSVPSPAPSAAGPRYDSAALGDVTAKIMVQMPDGRTCSLGSFNNTTGRVSDTKDHCAVVSDDSDGRPMGTVHRLEKIQKSFNGK
jgi:hypothetical protein